MKVFYLNIGLVLLIGISQISFAKLVTWTDNIPSALKPFDNNAQQIAAIAQDNILIYAHPATKTSLPTFSKQPQPIAKFSTAEVGS